MKRVIFLFCTIFFGLICKAEDLYTYGNYTYKIENETKKQICLYKFSDSGETTSLDIPSTIEHNNEIYTVTKIQGPNANTSEHIRCLIQDGCSITNIFFPSSLTYISQVSRELTTLKYAIFENGDNITNYPSGIFYYFNTNLSLDYVIIFNYTKDNLNSSHLVGGANASHFIENKITISYKNGTTEAVSIFLYYKHGDFNNITFNYLISALQKRGTDLNSISVIDLSKIKADFPFSFESNPANILSLGAKIILKNNNTLISTNPVIPDKADFTPPATDITGDITYNRFNTQNWNSVCLPFDIKESDFDGSSKIYTVTAATNERINLTRVDSENTVVEAGTPCFIYSTAENWTLNLSDVTISKDVAPILFPVGENWEVIGSFTNKTIGAGKYKLNSSGTEFGITNNEAATVTAFRCYLNYTGSQGAPNRLSVNIDEEASITLVPNDAEPQKVKLYDLMGRPRKEGSKGFFIKSTR